MLASFLFSELWLFLKNSLIFLETSNFATLLDLPTSTSEALLLRALLLPCQGGHHVTPCTRSYDQPHLFSGRCAAQVGVRGAKLLQEPRYIARTTLHKTLTFFRMRASSSSLFCGSMLSSSLKLSDSAVGRAHLQG